MNIYEITQSMLAIMGEIEENEGEITDEVAEKLKITSDQLADKAEAYCKLIRNTESDIAGIKGEIERLRKRQKSAENLIERLKASLVNAMEVSDQPKLKAGSFSLSVRRTESVNVTDIEALPSKYKREVVEVKADKNLIKEAIKNGEMVDGAELVENQSLNLR